MKENRKLGKGSDGKASSYSYSKTKNGHMFSYTYAIYLLVHV